MHPFKVLCLTATCIPLLWSCKKDTITETPDEPERTGNLTFEFKPFVNNKPLMPKTWYLNFFNDSFTVTRLNYYISNVKLKMADGTVFSEKESYHLNKHMENRETFMLGGIPEGTISGIEFIIGVDSSRNVSGAQTGALDVNEEMFWEWNTGYVFFKLEGECRTADPNRIDFSFHIGGFTGKNNCLQKCTFKLSQPIVITAGKTSSVFYHTNVEEVFKNPADLDIETVMQGGSTYLKAVSDNYSDMFTIDHVQN